jgi:predicted DNA-binding protein
MPLSFEITVDEKERFNRLATRSGRSSAALARYAFVAGLAQMEEDVRIADSLRGWVGSD